MHPPPRGDGGEYHAVVICEGVAAVAEGDDGLDTEEGVRHVAAAVILSDEGDDAAAVRLLSEGADAAAGETVAAILVDTGLVFRGRRFSLNCYWTLLLNCCLSCLGD